MTATRMYRNAEEFLALAPAAALAVCAEHGLRAFECDACTRFAGECDLGRCTRPATHYGEVVVGGRVVERRPVCRRDLRFARSLGMTVVSLPVVPAA